MVPRSRMAREGAALVERLHRAYVVAARAADERRVERLARGRFGASRIPKRWSHAAHCAQHARAQLAVGACAPAVKAGATASICAARSAPVEPAAGVDHRADRARRVGLRLAVAPLQRADRRAHERARGRRASVRVTHRTSSG